MDDSVFSEPTFMLPAECCLTLRTVRNHLSLFAALFASTNTDGNALLQINRFHLAECFEHYAEEMDAVLAMLTLGAYMSRDVH